MRWLIYGGKGWIGKMVVDILEEKGETSYVSGKRLDNICDILTELQHVKNQLIELRAKEDRVQDLKSWKEKIDDVASPTQLRSALQDVEDLKTFKTKAITIFTGVQMVMAGIWAFVTFMSG